MVIVLFPSMRNFDEHPAEDVHRLLGQWMAESGIEFIDLLPQYMGYSAGRLQATLLDKHPNADGYDIAGQAVADWLREIRPGNQAPGICS